MAEKRLSIEGTDPLLLFGLNDAFLRKIEDAFDQTDITARGHQLFLEGEPGDLDALESVFGELEQVLGRNGNLTEDDVETVLTLHTQDGGGPSGAAAAESAARVRPENRDAVLHTPSGDAIKPKTAGQGRLVASTRRNDIVFAIGPAGTGKTYVGMALAVAALKSRQVKRIVLTRPAVEAGEELGFLPGDFREKVDPYLRPLYDALGDMLPREKLEANLERQVVEIVPLAYMRGRTLRDSFVILDEAQNATTHQMKMFLTRLGPASHAIVTGDVTQTDLPKRSMSGLEQARRILTGIDGIDFIDFDRSDVVRHPLVKDIIKAYEDHTS
ncbi:MAG: phosphate starvation-inducible protein PhoH [Bacteroidetes bacterium QS_9_68_14]|nr:MAG: phosphate starvation-inducible protein PhoH [Bacteroidetes bacterium QS_9_68_14]